MKKSVFLFASFLAAIILQLGTIPVNVQPVNKLPRANKVAATKLTNILRVDGAPQPWPPPVQLQLLADGSPQPWPPPVDPKGLTVILS